MTILQKETEQIKKAFDDLRISAAYDPMVKLALEKAEGALRSLLIATADKIEKQAQEIEEQKLPQCFFFCQNINESKTE